MASIDEQYRNAYYATWDRLTDLQKSTTHVTRAGEAASRGAFMEACARLLLVLDQSAVTDPLKTMLIEVENDKISKEHAAVFNRILRNAPASALTKEGGWAPTTMTQVAIAMEGLSNTVKKLYVEKAEAAKALSDIDNDLQAVGRVFKRVLGGTDSRFHVGMVVMLSNGMHATVCSLNGPDGGIYVAYGDNNRQLITAAEQKHLKIVGQE